MNAILERRRALVAADKKGFTLVEVVVVLVILAILMAIAIPALTGYIDKARRDAATTEAGTALSAAQVIVTDAYGHPFVSSNATYYAYRDGVNVLAWNNAWALQTAGTAIGSVTPTGTVQNAIQQLTGVTFGAGTAITAVDATTRAVTGMTVILTDGRTATYANSAWTIQ